MGGRDRDDDFGIRPRKSATGLKRKNPIVVLGIDDNYRYRDPELVNLIRESYDNHTKELSE